MSVLEHYKVEFRRRLSDGGDGLVINNIYYIIYKRAYWFVTRFGPCYDKRNVCGVNQPGRKWSLTARNRGEENYRVFNLIKNKKNRYTIIMIIYKSVKLFYTSMCSVSSRRICFRRRYSLDRLIDPILDNALARTTKNFTLHRK